jgi:ankyrin repeat protein
MLASRNSHLDVVQALLARGADIDARMSAGATAPGAASPAEQAGARTLLVQARATP